LDLGNSLSKADPKSPLNILAGTYWCQGKYDVTLIHQKRALAILEKALGPENPKIAFVLERIASNYRKIGKLDKAKGLNERAKKFDLGLSLCVEGW
jgi:tetratricopeptide (TPR) repeat protein